MIKTNKQIVSLLKREVKIAITITETERILLRTVSSTQFII
jgi:hypothetical protein